ncbi:MAG: FAD-binding protein [Halobacteriovoraceae bacterium]|nr:FAD-binding protein [Halobacteriovoraceae bacterium]
MSLLSTEDINYLSNLSGVEISNDTDLTKFSTMKLHSQGSILKVSEIDSLKKVVSYLSKNGKKYRAIGWGANFILPENPDFVLVKIDLEFDKNKIDDSKSSFRLPGSAPLNVLTSLATKYGLKGWEVFTGVPASLGGAIAMNAGTNLGEIGELITEVEVLKKTGELKTIPMEKDSFTYRNNHFLEDGDIIVSAEMIHKGIDKSLGKLIKDYLQRRTDSQPLREKTCGCMFKNQSVTINDKEITCRAGQYIDIMGLKGFSKGNLRISPKHANFMENRGETGSEQVRTLVDETLEILKFHYGVTFETEVHLP